MMTSRVEVWGVLVWSVEAPMHNGRPNIALCPPKALSLSLVLSLCKALLPHLPLRMDRPKGPTCSREGACQPPLAWPGTSGLDSWPKANTEGGSETPPGRAVSRH